MRPTRVCPGAKSALSARLQDRQFQSWVALHCVALVLGFAGCTGGDGSRDFVDGMAQVEFSGAIAGVKLEPAATLIAEVEIEHVGFITDLDLQLDIEHPAVYSLEVELEHVDSGIRVQMLRRPPRYGRDITTILDDSASTEVGERGALGADDASEPAFPAPTYRPTQPLEYFYGQPIAGTWRLHVVNRSQKNSGRLRAWALDTDLAETHPGEAIYLSRSEHAATHIVAGAPEGFVVEVRRLAGLQGPITLELREGKALEAEPFEIAADAELGVLTIRADVDAELGSRDVVIRAGQGDVTRDLHLALDVSVFERSGVELQSYLSLAHLGAPGGEGSDCWGWTDARDGREIALVGSTAGLAIVDVSEASQPEFLGLLPTQSPDSSGNKWRDVKVYQDRAYVVSEASDHGLQIFDLRDLDLVRGPGTLAASGHYDGFGQAHNLFINEDTAMAYVVGADGSGDSGDYPHLCDGGVLMLDLDDPDDPEFVHCFAGSKPQGARDDDAFPSDVYTHDIQCVVYDGPDEAYRGHEICVTSDGQTDEDSDDWLAIVDVSDPSDPQQLARVGYKGAGYAHQGWLTPDHRYFLFNDEFDESDNDIDTRTYIWDLEKLDAPVLDHHFDSPSRAIGHNTYVVGDYAYQANYKAGLRIVDLRDIQSAGLAEVAFFDTYPEDDGDSLYHLGSQDSAALGFAGAWSNYPFFTSGNVLVCDLSRGMFMLRPEFTAPPNGN